MNTQHHDAERALHLLKAVHDKNKESFAVVKYYVKCLAQGDEFQLSADEKERYQQLLLAEQLNKDVLVKVHKHKKETIRLQVKKIKDFKNFMTSQQYQEVTKAIMASHMKKREAIPAYRQMANRYSELGDYARS